MVGIYNYRHLLKQLIIKDIKLKYRRSFLGYIWSVLNPMLIMLVMYIVFSQMFKVEIENFCAYLIIGQTLFTFMSEASNQSLFSILGNGPLLKKVYVPKYIFTLAKVTSSLVILLFSMGAMLIIFIITRVNFSLYMLLIPIIIIELYIFTLGLSLFLAQFAVFFRDIQYIYNVFTTAWMYLTPLFYPITQLSEPLQKGIKMFNPMFHYIDQFRTIVLYCTWPDWNSVIYGFFLAFCTLLLGGLMFYKNQEKFILYI